MEKAARGPICLRQTVHIEMMQVGRKEASHLDTRQRCFQQVSLEAVCGEVLAELPCST